MDTMILRNTRFAWGLLLWSVLPGSIEGQAITLPDGNGNYVVKAQIGRPIDA